MTMLCVIGYLGVTSGGVSVSRIDVYGNGCSIVDRRPRLDLRLHVPTTLRSVCEGRV